MGEGAARVKDGPRSAEVGRVAGEIDTLRHELGGLVGELDRRRHEALDLGLQVRRHPVIAAVAATAVALVLGGALASLVRTRRQRRRPTVRARQTRRALRRLMAHPERVAAERSVTNKIATAVAVAMSTALVKKLVERSVPPRRA